MRHHSNKRKFKRDKNERKALLKSLCVALINKEKIKTTEAKAREVRPIIEKIVTKSKTDDQATRRLISQKIGNGIALKKLFTELSPQYKDRNGGYTRITKIGRRLKDSSKMAFIEFVK